MQLFFCALCQEIFCSGQCKNPYQEFGNLYEHSVKNHFGSTVYINSSTGSTLIYYLGFIHYIGKLYCDRIGSCIEI